MSIDVTNSDLEAARQALDQLRFEHLLAIRELLTPDQRQQFLDQRQQRRDHPQPS
ncbi:MAG: hypothetical protein KGQ93_11980 [Cyanobacteria bacterium REEB459]|nr:hypothetical protein [Cyanobacteria bacterium REEB459]